MTDRSQAKVILAPPPPSWGPGRVKMMNIIIAKNRGVFT